MFRKLLYRLMRSKFKEVYDDGLAKGYELGYQMGKIERTNRGFIIGSKVDQQIEEILKEKGG